MKKNIFSYALLLSLVTLASAFDLSFLDTPYEFLDTIVMKAYKPIIWYLIFGWAQSFGCDLLTSKVIDLFVTTDTLTDTEKTEICTTGVKMYWEQFYYGGSIDNQPYDLGWSWSPS